MNLPAAFGWFDAVAVVALIVGIKRGRTKGMSVELLPMLQWLATIFLCGKLYAPISRPIAGVLHLGFPSTYPLAYILIALVVAIVFVFLRRTIGEKMSGTDMFGRMEFYLGMLAGAVKFACFLVAALALLNSKYISEEQRTADAKAEKETYGSSFFPSLASIQQDVFTHSFSGKLIKEKLSFLLIQPLSLPPADSATPPAAKPQPDAKQSDASPKKESKPDVTKDNPPAKK